MAFEFISVEKVETKKATLIKKKGVLYFICSLVIIIAGIAIYINRPQPSKQTKSFTIKSGQCLVNYVPFETAIFLAEKFKLPIYKGKGSKKHKITPAEAKKTNTAHYQILVKVFPRDHFDLEAMTYNGKPAIN